MTTVSRPVSTVSTMNASTMDTAAVGASTSPILVSRRVACAVVSCWPGVGRFTVPT